MSGALLLAFGYAFLMPLYEAGVLERYAPSRLHDHGSAASALAWHVVKLVTMNVGWLIFGIGLAMHANIFGAPAPTRPSVSYAPHEFVS